MAVPFDYPKKNWAEGKMRKRWEKPEGEYEVASMIPALRMRPDTSGWGVEIERFAGAGMTARGGSTARAGVTKGAEGLNPEIIQAYKAQTQGFGQPWEVGTINKQRNRRKGTRADPEGLDVYDAMDATTMPVELLTGKPFSEWNHKVLELAGTLHVKYSRATGATGIWGRDENLNPKKIPIDEFDPSEQASRTMKGISGSISIGGKGNRLRLKQSEEPKENMEE